MMNYGDWIDGKIIIMVRVLDGLSTDTLKERLHKEGIKSFKQNKKDLWLEPWLEKKDVFK